MSWQVFALPVGGGLLGLSPLPRPADLGALQDWGPGLVLSLTEPAETPQNLTSDLAALGVPHIALPIPDFGTPGPETQATWPKVRAQCLADLGQGRRVLVHCRGGCGRSGMVALSLMIAIGEPADTALVRLRKTRPCAIETDAQLDWAKTMGIG